MEEKKGLLAELGKVLEQYDSTEDIVKQNVSACLQSFSKELGVRLKDFEDRLGKIEKRLNDIDNKLVMLEAGESANDQAEEIPIPEEDVPISQDEVPTDAKFSAKEEVTEEGKPDWYDWEVDYPAAYVDDLIGSMGLNDKMQFINELFNGKEIEFENIMQEIDDMGSFKKIVSCLREEYPQWDETSDIVYKFYMHIRRKYDNKKAETEE